MSQTTRDQRGQQMADEWRLTLKLKSLRALREYMAFHSMTSGYALAKRAGISAGVVNFLLAGDRNTCSLKTARAIESALQCPPGFLFEPKMSQVAADSRRGRAA
ncbi:MAG: helix-turn-helix domain-containing protein [Rhodoglobus sp.]